MQPHSRRAWLQGVLGTLASITWSQSPSPSPEPYLDRAALDQLFRQQVKLLQQRYWSPEFAMWLDRPGNDLKAVYGGRINPPWWSCANAVETLADFMIQTQSRDWVELLAQLYQRHHDNPNHADALAAVLRQQGQWSPEDQQRHEIQKPQRHSTKAGFRDFCNEYLDDSGWWGLAWLRMHALTGQGDYLATAQRIQNHLHTHRLADDGIVWNLEQEPQKTNAISNGLFLTLSARLAKVMGDDSYRQQARRAYEWYLKQGLYDGVGIVDAPGHKGDHWSYNQGMWILGLLALHDLEPHAGHLQMASHFTEKLLKEGGLVQDGVIMEKLSQKGWDTALFKCVFVRALGTLAVRLPAETPLRQQITTLLRGSVQSFLKHSRSAVGEVGFQWQPEAQGQEWNFNTQLSAMSAVEAALACE